MKAILWDLDGTIADTEELHFQAWQATMTRYAIDYPYDVFLRSFGRNNAEILSELLPEPTPDKIGAISKEKERTFRSLVTPASVSMLPGVAHWLGWFKAAGLPQVIGSSGPMANIATVVAVLDIGDFFRGLLSGYALPKGKPDPLLFLRCAAAAGVDPGDCFVIEDSMHGIEAAQRGGMPCIAVGRQAMTDTVQTFVRTSSGPPCIAVATLAELDEARVRSLF